MENIIKEILLGLGADDCRIANIDRFYDAPKGFHPRDIYDGCKSVIVFIRKMPKGTAFVNPRIIYHRATEIILNELDIISYKGSIKIEEKCKAIAVPVPSDTPYEYWQNDTMEGRGILSMRHAGKACGIGSIGKNTLLINENFGNMINIGMILTNLDLQSDDFSKEFCIPNCRKCIDSCPTKALDGQTINQKLCRLFTYTKNDRGFSVVNCNKCRIECPLSFGIR